MGTESPDIWSRTAEISFGRAFCVFRIWFKTVKHHIEFLDKFSAKESVVISGKEVRIRVRNRKLQETGVTSGGKMPIAPTVDADSFPELAQLSTISTVVVFDKAPEDPISKPDEAEFISDTDADAEDTSCVDSSRTASSHSPVEEAEEIESDVACLVELGSPTREVSVTIPGVDTNCVSETLEYLGVPLSTPSTSIADKTLKAMEVVRMKKGNEYRHGLSVNNILFEPEGRLIAMEVKGFAFVSIYAPSGDQNKTYRDSFLRETIPAYVAQYKAPAIILGDFNAVDEIDDRKSSKTTSPKIRLALLEPLRNLRICDQRVKLKLLQHQLKETVNNSNLNHARYIELKREFLAWEREALRGFAIRSRVQSTAEEETSTFHMNKSTNNFQKSLTTQLKTNDNCKIIQSEQINLEIIKHYSGIFHNQAATNTQLTGKFIEGIRGVLNRIKPSKNDPGVSVVAQSLNAQVFNRGVRGSTPEFDNPLVFPSWTTLTKGRDCFHISPCYRVSLWAIFMKN
ncbi:hypothetical protein OUZ56_032983 [Daphnia magna]|uniref:Endonuclease/exonuclease/phosphatase domain-containing protein n=1 Tax=Daphnia magna TaxID=35525 RepID=A0ABR0B9X9_9CRUS|nr:hypothetical protein OUZ56_032983 [Daphnia magna]